MALAEQYIAVLSETILAWRPGLGAVRGSHRIPLSCTAPNWVSPVAPCGLGCVAEQPR